MNEKTGENFDVAMGSFDGAEICELVGLFFFTDLLAFSKIPQMIGRRISDLSFEKAPPEYNQALQRSDFKHTIMYKPSQSSPHRINNNNQKKRKQNIIWFNPPFSKKCCNKYRKNSLYCLNIFFPTADIRSSINKISS